MPTRRVRFRAPLALSVALVTVLTASVLAPGGSEPAYAADTRSISGRVFLGAADRPAQAGEVAVEYQQRGLDRDPTQVVPIAADGSYRIDGLPDGTSWFVFFRYNGAESYASQWFKEEPAILYPIQSINLNGADRTDVDQTLQRKGSIQGKVSLGDAGTSAPAGSVGVSYRAFQGEGRWSPWSAPVPVDAQGGYLISDVLPSTSVALSFSYSGEGPFQSIYWPSAHYEHQTSLIAVGSPWKPAGTFADVTLPRKTAISGGIFLGSAESPAPAGSARVSIEYGARTWSDATMKWQPVENGSVLTSADGGYQFSGLVSGTYRVIVEYLAGTGYAPKTTVEVQPGLNARQDITLERAYSVRGQVHLGSTDRPAGEGEVLVSAHRVFPSDWPAYGPVATAADGTYELTGLPTGYYEIRLHYTGDEDFPDRTWAHSVCNDLGCHTPVTADMSGYDLLMPHGRGLYGIARNADGVPLQGITVTMRSYSESAGEWVIAGRAVTAADGRYRFNSVADAHYRVSFSDAGGAYAAHNWPGMSDYYEPWLVDMTAGRDPGSIDATMLRPGSIEGRVMGTGFSPDPTRLTVEVLVYDDATATWVGTGDVYPVDSSGRYRIPDLVPDWYRVVAWYDGTDSSGSGVSGVLTLDDAETLSADLTVKRVGLAPARDFSEDGIPDVLVVAGNGALIRYTGSGDGGWSGAAQIGVGWNGMTAVLSAGDFTGDGNNDILARDGSGDLWLYPRDGAGGWKVASRIGWGWSSLTELFSPGDFDGDGSPDVMARDAGGGLWLYRGNGRGGWAGAVQVGSGWNGFTSIFSPGDFDGDGNEDVMGRDGVGRLWLYPGNGAGGWRSPSVVGSGWNMFSAIIGMNDFDGDGRPDLIARDSIGDLWLYRGNGASGWSWNGQGTRVGWGWSGLRFVS